MTKPVAIAALLLICCLQTGATCAPPLTGVTDPASPQRGDPPRGAVHALSWHEVPPSCRHITPMIWIKPYTDPRKAAELSRSKPAGRVGLLVTYLVKDLLSHPEDVCRTENGDPTEYYSPWPDHAVDKMRKRIGTFFSDYANAGGGLDVLVVDFEKYMSSWSLTREHLQAIEDDPRSQKLKQQLGFGDFERVLSFRASDAYLTWNAVLHSRICEALDRAMIDFVGQLYPNAKSNNYGAYILAKEHVVPDRNGHRQYRLNHCGTHGSRAFYGREGRLSKMKLDGEHLYGRSPFAVLRWHLNMMRAIRRSSEVPFMPWVSHKRWHRTVYRDNRYYEELIFHLALSGADGFLYWNPHHRKNRHKPNMVFADDDQDLLLDHCLDQLNRRLGTGRRACVTLDSIDWDSPLLTTGMRIDQDRILWRVTAPPGVDRVRVAHDGSVLELRDGVGAWYESAVGQEIRFEADG